MPKNKPCDECGERKPDVRRQVDPYAAEVNGEAWFRWLCGVCFADRMDEI